MPPKDARKPAATLQLAPSRISKAPKKTARRARVPPTYPWDSHQDDIIVNSPEDPRPEPITGVEDYKQKLALQQSYEHITTDFDEYRRNFTKEEDLPKHDDSEQDEGRDWEEQEGIDYTLLPSPPPSMSDYDAHIYKAHTANPAAFLAIIRLAQRNLPFLSWEGAINHLPNHSPADPLPKLEPGTFADDVVHTKRHNDTQITILFLPDFYLDGRHALGFYTFAPPAHPSSNPAKALFQSIKNVVFTPCTTSDLEVYDLVEYVGSAAKGMRGVEKMKCVGARGGKWLDQETVEDYEEWSEGVRIVRSVWERRVELCCGGEEAPGPMR
jgi:hypothetical protein